MKVEKDATTTTIKLSEQERKGLIIFLWDAMSAMMERGEPIPNNILKMWKDLQ